MLCSSAAARIGLANHEAIAAAKAGVIGLTLAEAATYAARNIRVNCVAPGLVDTTLTAKIMGNEAALKASIGMHALGRVGKPEHIASAIAWLLDPDKRLGDRTSVGRGWRFGQRAFGGEVAQSARWDWGSGGRAWTAATLVRQAGVILHAAREYSPVV